MTPRNTDASPDASLFASARAWTALACTLMGFFAGCGGSPAAGPQPVPMASSTVDPSAAVSHPAGGPAPAASSPPIALLLTPTAPPPPVKVRPTTLPLATGSGAPGDAELAVGDDAFEHGDLAGAQRAYDAARTAAPKNAAGSAPSVVGLARVRIARTGVALDYGAGIVKGAVHGEIVAAAADLARAAKSLPTLGAAFVELGRARLLLGDAPGALDALHHGVELLPDEPEAHSQLGIASLATGHANDAVRELARAAELDPGSGARHGNLGTALMMAGRTREAIAEYETRAHSDDGDARAHSDLGTALLATDDLARATSELERASQLDPGRATFHSNLGYAHQQAGHLDRALVEYHEALRIDPTLASAWINLATVLSRNPKTRGDARAALLHARSASPDDPRVKANLDELEALEKATPAASFPDAGLAP